MRIILFLALVCTGIYYEYQSCFFSIFLICLLYYTVRKNGALIWKQNYCAYYFFGLAGWYFLSALWAVDSHMALLGGLKFLPVSLCALLFMQKPALREELLEHLPAFGTLLTLFSAAGSMAPSLREYLWTGNRLAGTFQYPNTFALFLLLCLLILLHQKEHRRTDVVQGVVLLAGILLTGSRTVFLLMLASLLISALLLQEKRRRIICLGFLGGIAILAVCILIVKGDGTGLRLLELSLSESTLLGRILYWKDALPVILRNPLGLGYMGYYFTQGSFQTGVYTVTHVHNEFLQAFLDGGWLIGTGFLGAWIYGFWHADCGWKRLLLAVMGLHALVDFDLQYMAVYVVFLALLPWERGRQKQIRSKGLIKAFSVCLLIVLCYSGIGNAAYYFHCQGFAERFYPENTFLQIEELKSTENADEMDRIAEDILKHNEAVALAWDARARVAFSRGDIQQMMVCKRKAIALSKYALEEYEDYLDMLLAAAQWYAQADDRESAAYCLQEALGIPEQLNNVKEGTDAIGWKIQDKPELELPQRYQPALDEIQKNIDF